MSTIIYEICCITCQSGLVTLDWSNEKFPITRPMFTFAQMLLAKRRSPGPMMREWRYIVFGIQHITFSYFLGMCRGTCLSTAMCHNCCISYCLSTMGCPSIFYSSGEAQFSHSQLTIHIVCIWQVIGNYAILQGIFYNW